MFSGCGLSGRANRYGGLPSCHLKFSGAESAAQAGGQAGGLPHLPNEPAACRQPPPSDRSTLVRGLKQESKKDEKRHRDSMTNSAGNRSAVAAGNLFRSFWIGGFECSSHVNRFGTRLDMTAAVGHDRFAEQDYALMRSAGLLTARDGLRWHLIDHGGKYDFSSFVPMLRASLHNGVQVIWDLFHYGYPNDIDILKPAFVDRFAHFCTAAARVFADNTDDVPFWTPVNEISFFTWAGSRSLIFPFAYGKDEALKRQVVRAAIAGAQAVRSVDPRARLVYPEPTINAVADAGCPDQCAIAEGDTEAQYEAFDMLAGIREPLLGGSPELLDIPGLNFYYTNQWEQVDGQRVFMRWLPEERDPRWTPLSELLARFWRRYNRPLFIAETGHFGAGRALWLEGIAEEAERAIRMGVPLEGICLYPILDRYDWEDPSHWHNSGLWDLALDADGTYRRVLNREYAEELERARERV